MFFNADVISGCEVARMTILLQLFRWIYSHALGLFVAREAGDILLRAAFVAAVVATVVIIYGLYSVAIASISLAIPAPFDYGLIFLPDNTTACLTIITSLRAGLFLASLKLGFASVGVK